MKFFKHVLMNTAGDGGAGGGSAAGAVGGGAAGAGAASGAGTSGASGAAGTSSGGGAPAGAAAASVDWTSGLNEDFKGFVQNKGWKDPTQVVDSYRNLEKLLGAPQDQVIKLPKEDDAAGWEAVMNRLGRPATPDAYKLPVPEGDKGEFAKWASDVFHKAGLSEKQGKAIAEAWNAQTLNMQSGAKEAYTAKVTQEQAALKKEWGAAHDQNMAMAQRAAREFGADPKMIDAIEGSIGLAATMKFFQNLGSRMGESSFVIGSQNGGNGPMTPAQAKSQITALKSDPGFVSKYVSGDAEARAKMQRLHEFAYPEES